MRLGVLLPTFQRSPDATFEVARRAARAGLDGVFAYDHLWPMGSPNRPALAPFEMLAAVAVREPDLVVGPLVARVSLVADEVLVAQLRALMLVSQGRTICGLGTGDRKSADENLAYGVAVAPPAERRTSLRTVAEALVADGAEVWIGDGAAATRRVAFEVGCTLNLWQATAEDVSEVAASSAVSWAGAAPRADGTCDEASCAALLRGLDRAGATWAVFTPSMEPEVLARLGAGLGEGESG